MKNEVKEIIAFTKSAIENVDNVDIVDEYFDEIKDITDTITGIIKPAQAFIRVYEIVRKRKFKVFLKAYAKEINNHFEGAFSEKNTKVLKKYLKRKQNLNFIYESIDCAINSKTIHCSTLLGFYTGQILLHEIEIGLKELMTINALKTLNDIELEMCIRIYDTSNLAIPNDIDDNAELGLHKYFAKLTVQKLKSLQILEEETTGRMDTKSGWGTFISTENFEELVELTKRTGVDKLLIDY